MFVSPLVQILKLNHQGEVSGSWTFVMWFVPEGVDALIIDISALDMTR